MNRKLDEQRDFSFEFFNGFKRIKAVNPLISLPPPQWAAATHAIVVNETVHYYWCKREWEKGRERWVLMHATAPVTDPIKLTQDPRNPILEPSSNKWFDNASIEYPFPFLNPTDQKYYMYYRGRGIETPEQTGLLVNDGDLGKWTRVRQTPVIAADNDYDRDGSTHPSVAVVDEVIHIIYTGKATLSFERGLTMCHAKAPTSDPASVIKDPNNPVFTGSGAEWDSWAVRETELFKGSQYFHILYGGYDGEIWRIGHVRTRDFRTFEPNPFNPIFTPADNSDAWDCDGVLTAQIFEIGGVFYMLYAGKRGSEWQTGIAIHENLQNQ